MKTIVFLAANLIAFSMFCQTSKFTKEKKLYSDMTFDISYHYIDSITSSYKLKSIGNKYANEVVSNPILKTIGIEKKADCFYDNIKVPLKDNIIEGINHSYNNFYHYFVPFTRCIGTFLHKAIKIKKVREFAMNITGNFLVELCEYYPKDFKAMVIDKIKECQGFINNEMPKHKYEIVGKHLFIDNKGVDLNIAQSMKVFILRRILMDNIPKEEINGYLNTLLHKVQAVDVSNNPDILLKININNHLDYCVSATGNYILIKNRKIKPNKNIGDYPEITCLHDGYNYYYKIKYGTCWWGNQVFLVDTNGDIMYEGEEKCDKPEF